MSWSSNLFWSIGALASFEHLHRLWFYHFPGHFIPLLGLLLRCQSFLWFWIYMYPCPSLPVLSSKTNDPLIALFITSLHQGLRNSLIFRSRCCSHLAGLVRDEPKFQNTDPSPGSAPPATKVWTETQLLCTCWVSKFVSELGYWGPALVWIFSSSHPQYHSNHFPSSSCHPITFGLLPNLQLSSGVVRV